jgi:hypothetical protein
MRIDELWGALEEDAVTGKGGEGVWLLRLAKSVGTCPLFVGLEPASRRRAVLLRLPSSAIPIRRQWPRSKGLEPFVVSLDGSPHFGVGLKESRFADVFTALVEDLARRVIEAGDPAAQAQAFVGQLVRWQKFLSASLSGLSEEAQRGLWGELYFLREQLFPVLGASAVNGWKGGERAHQDFQFKAGAIEVKATLAKQPQIVRISSERQLDDSSWPVLCLNVIALDAREGGGETLPAMIASLRLKLSGEAAVQEQFEDGLLEWGYLEAHAMRYCDRGYIVRSEKAFQIKHGFPRVVEQDLPVGIGAVEYGLSIAACEAFLLNTADLARIMNKLLPSSR